MSIRIHVVGAYGATAEEFQNALNAAAAEPGEETCRRFRFGSSGKWQWANASVWNVNGSDIDEALASLAVPGIRTTTSDGILWMITLTGNNRPLFRGVHFFCQMPDPANADAVEDDEEEEEDEFDEDFPADEVEEVAGINKFVKELAFLWDEEEAVRVKAEWADSQSTNPVNDEYIDYGVVLPEAIVSQMKQQRESQAHRTAFQAHGAQIGDELVAHAIPCDRDAMVQLLTEGPLTELEQDSELADLPRFLEMLGIEGVFAAPATGDAGDPSEEASAEEEEFDEDEEESTSDWTDYNTTQLLTPALRLAESRPLVDVRNGPVRLSLVQVAQLHLLAHLCSADTRPVLACFQWPGRAAMPVGPWEDLDELEARQQGGHWQLAWQPRLWWHSAEEQSDFDEHEFVGCLQSLPEETRVELAFLVDGPSEQCHRYAGVLRDGAFILQESFPVLDKAAITEALAIINLIIGTPAIAIDSPREEAAIRQAYQQKEQGVPRIKNGKIKPEYGQRDTVVRAKLFETFRDRGIWDIAGAEARIAESWDEFQSWVDGDHSDDNSDDEPDEEVAEQVRQLTEMMQQIENAKAVPHGEELVYQGQVARFYRASMIELEHVTEDDLARDDQAMAALGFQCIGDMVADIDREELSRCYAGPANAIALLGRRQASNNFALAGDGVVVDFSKGIREFHTHFDDGSTLVTNDTYGATSTPGRGIYVRTYEEFALPDLWNKHLDGIARFEQHRGTKPISHTQCTEPAEYCALADQLLARVPGIEKKRKGQSS